MVAVGVTKTRSRSKREGRFGADSFDIILPEPMLSCQFLATRVFHRQQIYNKNGLKPKENTKSVNAE
jgi:hypothetical protein